MRIRRVLCVFFLLLLLTSCEKELETTYLHAVTAVSWSTYDEAAGLHNNVIYCVETDKNGNVWIGTSEQGIAKFDGTNWTVYTRNNSGLSCDSIWDMTVDHQGNVWIGTRNGLTKFDGTNWTVYTAENSELPINTISQVAVDRDNNVWIGCGNSHEGGLMKYDGENWTLFTPENSDLPCRIINEIFVDKSNTVWIGTGQYQGLGGVVRIDGDEWTVYSMDNTIMPYDHADMITQDASGNIWVAQRAVYYDELNVFEGALLKYDGKTWTVIKPHDFKPKLTNRITTLKADRNDNIWITTKPEYGPPIEKYEIAMFNGTNWTVMSDLDSTIHSEYVRDMEFDSNNTLWIGQTGFGLTKMNFTFE